MYPTLTIHCEVKNLIGTLKLNTIIVQDNQISIDMVPYNSHRDHERCLGSAFQGLQLVSVFFVWVHLFEQTHFND